MLLNDSLFLKDQKKIGGKLIREVFNYEFTGGFGC